MKTAPGKSPTVEPSDPSALTTDAVHREIEHLRELLEGRLDGMDEAVKILHQDMVRVPTELDKATGSLRELLEAKIKGWTDLQAAKITAAKELSDAKLKGARELSEAKHAAIKEAMNKSEGRTATELRDLGRLMTKSDDSCDDKVNELRTRLTMIDGRTAGQRTTQDRQTVNWNLVLTVAGVLIALAILVLVLLGIKT